MQSNVYVYQFYNRLAGYTLRPLDIALQNGLVDIKVCAVSDVWSGLKLVIPVAKRSKK